MDSGLFIDSPGTGSGEAFVEELLKLDGDAVAREEAMVAAVEAGSARVLWGTVESKWKDHVATIPVMRDVLAVGAEDDFVRVSVNYSTAQRIAELLNAQLLTPHVADLIYDHADVRIQPQVQAWWQDNSMSRVDRMREYDGIVRRALGAVGATSDARLANLGKHWVMTKLLLEPVHAGRAANYGWHKGPTSAAGVLQPLETGHDLVWVDYSQMVQLMGQVMTVDGESMRTADVMMSTELFGLVSSDPIVTGSGGSR